MFRVLSVWRNVRGLREADEKKRIAAAQALGELADKRALDPLIEAVVDPRSAVRLAAAEALAKLGDARWKPWVKGDIGDFDRVAGSRDLRLVGPFVKLLRDRYLQGQAARALGKLGDKRAVKELIQLLSFCESGAFRAVVFALGQLGDMRAREPLLKQLLHEDSDFRLAAANALAELGDAQWEYVVGYGNDLARLKQSQDPVMCRLLKKDPIAELPEIVQQAYRALANRGATGPALQVLDCSEFWPRKAMVEALAALGDRRALEPLRKALHDSFGEIRGAAASALQKLGDTSAVEPLIEMLEDRDWTIRRAAAGVLGQFGDRRAVEPLIRIVTDSEVREVKAAIAKHRETGNRQLIDELIKGLDKAYGWVTNSSYKERLRKELGEALDTLIKIADSRTATVAVYAAAAESLGVLRDARAVGPLVALLEYPHPEVASVAARALGKLGDSRAVGPLIRMIAHPACSDGGAFVAIRALEELGGNEAAQGLITVLSHGGLEVRRQAAQALAEMGDNRGVPALAEMLQEEYLFTSRILGKLGDMRALEPLVLKGILKNCLGDLGGALAALCSTAGANAFLTGLQRLDPAQCETALRALIAAGTDSGVDQKMNERTAAAVTDLLSRLGHSRVGTSSAVALLVDGLKSKNGQSRRVAAKMLVRLARVHPALFRGRYEELGNIIRQPHYDAYGCFDHGDSGIGLSFPAEPPPDVIPAVPTGPSASASAKPAVSSAEDQGFVRFACSNPACRKKLKVPSLLAGTRGRCPACGQAITIPANSEPGKPNTTARDF